MRTIDPRGTKQNYNLQHIVPILTLRYTSPINPQVSCISDGNDAVTEKSCIHVTYRKHLVYMLAYEFPEHYGEILNALLKFSESESIHCAVWYDFLNVLLYGEAAVDNIVQVNIESMICFFVIILIALFSGKFTQRVR